MDNYGLAIADADEAIKYDPTYAKAYYRKADANIALDHYDKALASLKKVVMELKVKDNDALEKFKFVKKVIKERAFLEAIKTDEVHTHIDVNDIIVEPSYSGPKIDD
jgi:serine/threonine-protein phosphatase 5